MSSEDDELKGLLGLPEEETELDVSMAWPIHFTYSVGFTPSLNRTTSPAILALTVFVAHLCRVGLAEWLHSSCPSEPRC